MFADVIYMPTNIKNSKFDPKKANKYHQCACRSTKVDGICMLDIAYLVSGRGPEYRSRYRYSIGARVKEVCARLARQ